MKDVVILALPKIASPSAIANRVSGKYLSFILFALLLFIPCHEADGQAATPSPTPSEEELRLQEEKRLIELRRDIELAKKEIREAQPEPAKPTATPLEGDAVLKEGVRLETELVSYKAMSEVTNQISIEISKRVSAAKNISIYDAQVVKDWRFYQALFPAFRGQSEDIRDNYIELLCDEEKKSGVTEYFRETHCTSKENQSFTRQNRAEIAEMKPLAISEALGFGATLIKSFIDLVALFRTDTTIEGKQVTIDQTALVAEVLRALKNQFPCDNSKVRDCRGARVSLYYPGVFPPQINTGKSRTIIGIGQLFIFKTEAERIIKERSAERPQLVEDLAELQAKKTSTEKELEQVTNLQQILNNLNMALGLEPISVFRRKLWSEIKSVTLQLAKLHSQNDLEASLTGVQTDVSRVKSKIKEIDMAVKSLTDLNERFQNFVDQFVKIGENGINTLALFIKSEEIEAIMGDDESYWLEIRSVSAGGNNRTRKNLIWFFAGARVDHSGGAIIEYTLYDRHGAVVNSDKYSYYEGYIEPKKMQKGQLIDSVK